jgi:hypothetical protein
MPYLEPAQEEESAANVHTGQNQTFCVQLSVSATGGVDYSSCSGEHSSSIYRRARRAGAAI